MGGREVGTGKMLDILVLGGKLDILKDFHISMIEKHRFDAFVRKTGYTAVTIPKFPCLTTKMFHMSHFGATVA